MKRKLIIDTDCGSDDAIALAMALNDDRYEIIMISTIAGNVPLKQATHNTLTVLKMVDNYYPPVYMGCDRMLKRELVGAADTHGEDGMGDLDLVDYSLTCSQGDGVDKIIETIDENEDGSIDLIALGPLTNIAEAIIKSPETMKKLHRLIIMGSAGFGEGNVTEKAEFNVWQDPDSCEIVLNSGIEQLIFVGWDACLGDCILKGDEIARIYNSSPMGRFLIDSNRILLKYNKERFDEEILDLADPVAMAVALYPECIRKCERYFCRVETENENDYGVFYISDTEEKNAYVCSQLDADKFKEYLFRTLKC